MELKEKDKAYVAGTYARFPVEIVSGKGSLAYDENGKKYIDFTSGIGVTAFGLCDDEWTAAVTQQLGKVQHMSNLFYTQPCADLAELLCEKTGMKKVFFCNSGAEANECAIKAARKYASEHHGSDYYTVLTLNNSFHGRTLATLAATGQDHFHELFQPLPAGFISVDANDQEAVKEAVRNHKLAGIMIECVQGEGGVNNLEADFVKGIEKICRDEDLVFIVDEVQTGNGRTGKLYAYMNYDVQPDVVTTAKGLGNGLPIGATILGEKTENIFKPGDNGSTFGGNPVVCAGACSILSRIDEELLAEVKAKGDYLREAFTGAEGIEEVTGMGLIIGLKTTKKPIDAVNACIEKGVLCLTAKDKIRLLPAVNIPWDLVKEAAEVIKEACK